MSGDHNMHQTDSGWRKRQIALDKKAENARELGLNYEPNKTVVEMAFRDGLEHFEALVRVDEREACAKVVECLFDDSSDPVLALIVDAIRARGQHD